MTRREIIYQSAHLTVVHSEHDSPTVFASFNELGMRSNGDRFWGDDLFDRVGASAIGFVTARPNWYSMIDMLPAIDVARARIAGRRVVSYGHSQGGYGALKFGAQLGASFALGFCPQWSINPDDVAGFDTRFVGSYDRLLRNGERIEAEDLCPKNFIFLDPANVPDAMNAARLVALGRVTRVPVPFSGHGTVILIAEGGKGRALIQRCMEPADPTAAELRGMLRSCRARSRVYAEGKVRQLSQTMRRHGGFLETALKAVPEGPAKTLTVVNIELAKQDLDAAQSAMSALTDEQILNLHFGQYWTTFRNSGFVYGESRIGPLYRQRYKDDVFERLHGVNSLIRSGAEDLALEELGCLTKMPGAPRFLSHFLEFYRQLNRLDLAGAFAETLAGDESISMPQRIRIGFDLVFEYQRRRLRPLLFRELQNLSGLCRDDIDSTLRIIEMYIEIGELGFARQVLNRAHVPQTHRNLVDAYLAQLNITSNRDAAEEEVRRLLNQRSDDLQFWIKLSYLAEQLVGRRAAIEASRNALALSHADPAPFLHRLAYLLVGAGDVSGAIKELRQLLATDMAATNRAQAYADLAARCGKPDLAVAFASKWMAAEPSSAVANMTHLRHALAVSKGEAAAVLIEGVFRKVGSGLVALTRDQYVQLIDHARGIGYSFELRAFQLAVSAFPADPEFLAATSQGDFARKFFGPVDGAGDQPLKAPRRRGLLAMLGVGSRA